MPPETTDDFAAAGDDTLRKVRAAAIWIVLVTLVWFAAIVTERGDRIGRIVDSVLKWL